MQQPKRVLLFVSAGNLTFGRKNLESIYNNEMSFSELEALMNDVGVKAMLWDDFCEMAEIGSNGWEISSISDFIDYANDEGYIDNEDYILSKEALEFLSDKFIEVVDVIQNGTQKFILDLDGCIQEITDLEAAIIQVKVFVEYSKKPFPLIKKFSNGKDGNDRGAYWTQILRELQPL